MKSAGNVLVCAARLIVTRASSSGCRSDSKLRRLNSGSSSKKRTPWCESEISPGCGTVPPPTIPASEMVWCGLRNGRVHISDSPAGSLPVAE